MPNFQPQCSWVVSFPGARELGRCFVKAVLILTIAFFSGSAHSAGGHFTSERPALKSSYKRNLIICHTSKTESNSHPQTPTNSPSGDKPHHFISGWKDWREVTSLAEIAQGFYWGDMTMSEQPKLRATLMWHIPADLWSHTAASSTCAHPAGLQARLALCPAHFAISN